MDGKLAIVSPYADGQDSSNYTVDEVFPKIDPQFRPFGAKILVQVRRVMRMSRGGIALVSESTTTEAWNMQVGKIIAMGPVAFKNRRDNSDWPEGKWAEVGDFVRFPRHLGDRLHVEMDDDKGDPVVILIMDDHSLLGAYTGNPMRVRTFIQ